MHKLKSLNSQFGGVVTTLDKTQKGEVTCPRPHTRSRAKGDLDPGLLSLEATFATVPFPALP